MVKMRRNNNQMPGRQRRALRDWLGLTRKEPVSRLVLSEDLRWRNSLSNLIHLSHKRSGSILPASQTLLDLSIGLLILLQACLQ